MAENQYTEDSIRSLDWKEHIRLRPGMYIGKLGDGSSPDDGIYILIKEVIDNAIDEFVMGNGKTIDVSIKDKKVTIRDYGRGIPLTKVIDCVSKINTGAKYDSKVFKKSVGLNGVGTKAVNALSSYFKIQCVRDEKVKVAEFGQGIITNDSPIEPSSSRKGTKVVFEADASIFGNYRFVNEYVEKMLWNYCYLNTGLTIVFNGEKFYSENGLRDLLEKNVDSKIAYPIIHLKSDDIEVAMTHFSQGYGEQYHSFVNGQHTTQGGTHQTAFREAVVKTVREFFGKNFDSVDIRQSIAAAVSVKVIEPVFESQTKTKLGSNEIGPGMTTIRTFINDFVKVHLDNYLHKNPTTADGLLKKIQESEKERKALAGVKKLAKERAKTASLHNRKLRDCRVHLNDLKSEHRLESTLFITEGDSASGSITKVRNVNTQAVFSLKGKPLNSFGLTKKIVYENEEFNLLQAALNIEDGIDGLRYNNVVIATDADVDGMHIRLLLITFFLQFFPDLVREGYLYILETPLFRVRNKKETIYCYSESERKKALEKLGKNAEVTRFKGLGEISPNEFKYFIGKEMRLEPIIIGKDLSIKDMLTFYMGKNTPERQEFIIKNLKVEEDVI
ncbi:type IIA DNA topoisomerase subunit B [Flavobacteriales bacterium]|nr:type IIA DNA topoisomerase subunit B [Flavobacteriales bacterium]